MIKRNCVFIISLLAVFSVTSCDTVVSKVAKKSVAKIESKASRKVTKKLVEEGFEKTTKKVVVRTLKEVAKSDKALASLYGDFVSKIGREFADGITVESTDKGLRLVSKDFPNSAVDISKNMIIGKAGSLKNSGPVNEFLNYLLPNKTYIIDEAFVYKTDDLGRVISCSADRTRAFTSIERNTQRNSDVQKLVLDKLDGHPGLDQGGHLFANNTGGPNELINQIPMAKNLNMHGKWRQLERMEERALKQGKQVVSQRNLLYRGKENRPYAIEFITKIDGVETRTVIKNID